VQSHVRHVIYIYIYIYIYMYIMMYVCLYAEHALCFESCTQLILRDKMTDLDLPVLVPYIHNTKPYNNAVLLSVYLCVCVLINSNTHASVHMIHAHQKTYSMPASSMCMRACITIYNLYISSSSSSRTTPIEYINYKM